MRICPFCQSHLTASSAYFCEYCGNVLPESLHSDNSVVQEPDKIIKEEKKTKEKRPKISSGKHGISTTAKGIVAGVALGISLSLIFYIVLNPGKIKIPTFLNVSIEFNKGGEYEVEVPVAVPESSNEAGNAQDISDTVEMGLDIKEGSFGQNEIYSYVPYDSKLFVEFNDTATLEPYFGFLGGEFFTLVEKIKDGIAQSYGAFYLTKGTKSGWVVIAFPDLGKNIDVGAGDEIYADTVDKALVISQYPELIDEVRLAKSGVSKSLDVHPVLISIKPLLPSSGQIFIFKSSISDGDSVTEELIRQTLSEELKSIMTSFRNAESTYLVVK